MTPTQIFLAAFGEKNLARLFEDTVLTKRSVGKDGTSVKAFERRLQDEVALIAARVRAQRYEFTRYRERLISRGPHRLPRVISIPTVRDRLAMSALLSALSEIFPDAQRKLPHSYVAEISAQLNNDPELEWVLRIDIKDYYGSIEHDLLLRRIRSKVRMHAFLKLVKSAIANGTGNSKTNNKGVPQGISISNLLGEIYLVDIDRRMKGRYHYWRYVDDIIVLGKTERALVQIFERINRQIEKRGLQAHPLSTASAKSSIAHTTDGFEYLGFEIRPQHIRIRKSSYERFFSTIASIITGAKHRSRHRLIWRLNLRITGCTYEKKRIGWVFFFRQATDVSQFGRLDTFIRREMRRNEFRELLPKLKSLKRTYYEIRFNLNHSTYVPDFDVYDLDQMKQDLNLMGVPKDWILEAGEQEIYDRFFTLIRRETKEMEKDLIEAFS